MDEFIVMRPNSIHGEPSGEKSCIIINRGGTLSVETAFPEYGKETLAFLKERSEDPMAKSPKESTLYDYHTSGTYTRLNHWGKLDEAGEEDLNIWREALGITKK